MSETQPETKPWAVLDTLKDGFAVLDAKTTIRYLNPHFFINFFSSITIKTDMSAGFTPPIREA